MTKYFAGVTNIETLRKRYRELLRKYHPDNENGSVAITQEINTEYDRLFETLSRERKSDGRLNSYDGYEENKAFKEVLNNIAKVNADVEIIGCWIWVHGGFEYKELLKNVGFRYAPKKKCWCWHLGEYRRYHKKEISLDDIRTKYGSQTVNHKSRQCVLN